MAAIRESIPPTRDEEDIPLSPEADDDKDGFVLDVSPAGEADGLAVDPTGD